MKGSPTGGTIRRSVDPMKQSVSSGRTYQRSDPSIDAGIAAPGGKMGEYKGTPIKASGTDRFGPWGIRPVSEAGGKTNGLPNMLPVLQLAAKEAARELEKWIGEFQIPEIDWEKVYEIWALLKGEGLMSNQYLKPGEWVVNTDCGVVQAAPVSYTSSTNCLAVSNLPFPPSSEFNPAWGSIEEWQALPQPDPFGMNWMVQKKYTPAPGLGYTPVIQSPVVRVGPRQAPDPAWKEMVRPRYAFDPDVIPHPKTDPEKRLAFRPSTQTAREFDFRGNRPVKIRSGTHFNAPGRRERKRSGVPAGFFGALAVFHTATEMCDFFQSVSKGLQGVRVHRSALGRGDRPGSGCMGAILHTIDRIHILGDYDARGDWKPSFDASRQQILADILWNLAENGVQDRALAKLLGANWRLGVRDFNSSYEVGVSTDVSIQNVMEAF